MQCHASQPDTQIRRSSSTRQVSVHADTADTLQTDTQKARASGLFPEARALFILRFSRLAPIMGALRLSDICAAAQAS